MFDVVTYIDYDNSGIKPASATSHERWGRGRNGDELKNVWHFFGQCVQCDWINLVELGTKKGTCRILPAFGQIPNKNRNWVGFKFKIELQITTSRTSANSHLSTTASFFRPGIKKSIHWLLFKTFLQRPPLYNGHFLQCPQGGRWREVELYRWALNRSCLIWKFTDDVT